MEGRKTEMIKKMVLLTRPNYYTLFYKQDTAILTEVFEKLRWELQSTTTPLSYHYHYYNFIGVYFAVRGNYGKAEEYLLEAIRLKSNSEVTLANYVILICDCGRREQAAIYFKRLNELKKNSLQVNLDLALLFQLFDLNVAARQLFEEVIANNTNVSNDFLMFQFGRVLLDHSMGKMYYDNTLDKAIRIFIDINKRVPSFLPNTLALITALNYKWKQSQKSSGTNTVHPHSEVLASKINVTNYINQSHALYILGKIRMKTRQAQEAKECLVKSVELSPRVENHYQLGKCRMRLSELSEAGTEFKAAQRISKRFRTTVLLKEAEAMVEIGRRTDALRLIHGASDKYSITQHDKAALELFSSELNIMAFPEVISTLDRTLRLLYKSFSRNIYRRFIRVAKMFTDHLSQYYTTTGLPHTQAEVFLKWTKFLEDRKEITPEKHAELTKVKDYAARTQNPGRRLSVSRGPNSVRRRSSILRIGSGVQRPSEAARPGDQAPSPDISSTVSNDSKVSSAAGPGTTTSTRTRRKSILGGIRPDMSQHVPIKNSFMFSVGITNEICEES